VKSSSHWRDSHLRGRRTRVPSRPSATPGHSVVNSKTWLTADRSGPASRLRPERPHRRARPGRQWRS
jgi:hypothetical protein